MEASLIDSLNNEKTKSLKFYSFSQNNLLNFPLFFCLSDGYATLRWHTKTKQVTVVVINSYKGLLCFEHKNLLNPIRLSWVVSDPSHFFCFITQNPCTPGIHIPTLKTYRTRGPSVLNGVSRVIAWPLQ